METMSVNYLIIGDSHGDLDFIHLMCVLASDTGSEIIQVGDWGFVWPKGSQLTELSNKLKGWDVTMRFIDGNHDWHEEINRRALQSGGKPDKNGIVREGTEIAPNVIYQPRGSSYTDEEGTKFVFMGGAPSIDKAMRRDGISWWATEEITDEDMEVGLANQWCHVLVTHDAPDYPSGFGPKGTPEFRVASRRSMNNIRRLITQLKPELHMHGHWHHAYSDGVTRGLDCNYARLSGDAWYLWSRLDI